MGVRENERTRYWDDILTPLIGADGQTEAILCAPRNVTDRRAAGLHKHVTAHTLRHAAATWLRQQTGDPRLVAEYLGHADFSTVGRYAHVATDELHAAAAVLGDRAGLMSANEQTTTPRYSPERESRAPSRSSETIGRMRRAWTDLASPRTIGTLRPSPRTG